MSAPSVSHPSDSRLFAAGSVRSVPNGGSRNTTPNASVGRRRKRRASVWVTCPFVAPHSPSSRMSSRAATGSCSTNSTCRAFLESASRPSAPLPANRSRQRAPATRAPSQLNSVSRTRSGVGRISGPAAKRSLRPRHVPPMMRSTRERAPRACDAVRRFRSEAPSAVKMCTVCALARRSSLLASLRRYNSAMIFRREDGRSESAERQGFFKRLGARLNRGGSWLSLDLASLFRGRKIDVEILEELETRLLTADVGVEATAHILARLNRRVERRELADVAALIAALRESIAELLEPSARPLVIDAAHKP